MPLHSLPPAPNTVCMEEVYEVKLFLFLARIREVAVIGRPSASTPILCPKGG